MSAAAKKKGPPPLPSKYRLVDEAKWALCDGLNCSTTAGLGIYLDKLDDAVLAEVGLAREAGSGEPVAGSGPSPELLDAARDAIHAIETAELLRDVMDGDRVAGPEGDRRDGESTLEIAEGSPVTVEVDGFLIDAESGEVLGPVVEEGFAVDSPQRLDWVLRRLGEVESQMVAIEQTDAVIHARAVLANAERLKADLKRRLDSLHWRFDNEVEHYARQQLAGEKGRTLKTLYGSISLRSVPARIGIDDKALAIARLIEECPAALNVEFQLHQLGEGLDADIARRAVLDMAAEAGGGATLDPKISRVPKGLQAELAARTETGFVRHPESETMSIDTGVKS